MILIKIGKYLVIGGSNINDLINYNDELEVICFKDKVYLGDSCIFCEDGKILNFI